MCVYGAKVGGYGRNLRKYAYNMNWQLYNLEYSAIAYFQLYFHAFHLKIYLRLMLWSAGFSTFEGLLQH
jgi:hypothetical protein